MIKLGNKLYFKPNAFGREIPIALGNSSAPITSRSSKHEKKPKGAGAGKSFTIEPQPAQTCHVGGCSENIMYIATGPNTCWQDLPSKIKGYSSQHHTTFPGVVSVNFIELYIARVKNIPSKGSKKSLPCQSSCDSTIRSMYLGRS